MEVVSKRVLLLDAGMVGLGGAAAGRALGTRQLLAGMAALGLVRAAALVRLRLAGRAGGTGRRQVRRKAGRPASPELVLLPAQPPAEEPSDLAVTDALTGLPNRRGVERALDEACRRAARGNEPLSVLVFQVRETAQIRRLYGPQAARDVLRQAGVRLSHAIAASGTVGRWAGEEFVAVLPGVRAEAAGLLAERLCRLLEADPFRLSSGRRVPVAMACGWAAAPRDGISGPFLVSRAQVRAAGQRTEAESAVLG